MTKLIITKHLCVLITILNTDSGQSNSCITTTRDVYHRKVDKSMPDPFRPLPQSLQGLNQTKSVNILCIFIKKIPAVSNSESELTEKFLLRTCVLYAYLCDVTMGLVLSMVV